MTSWIAVFIGKGRSKSRVNVIFAVVPGRKGQGHRQSG